MNIILELGCNHNGSIATAKRMIDDAERLKVRGVKLQKRDIDSFPLDVGALPRDLKTSFGTTYREHRKFLEFNEKQISELKNYAGDRGLLFVMSVFDIPSMDSMVQIGVGSIKLPSQFLCNDAMNRALAKHVQCAPIRTMHSTGMHTTKEVLSCAWLYSFDVTFYCRSIYPHDKEQSDVASAIAIYNKIWCRSHCGYSSHDLNGGAIPYFILAGANWIERHYTLDKNMKGSDHGTVSSDYDEMKLILHNIDEISECMYANKLCDEEKRIRDMYIGKGV